MQVPVAPLKQHAGYFQRGTGVTNMHVDSLDDSNDIKAGTGEWKISYRNATDFIA
jgi:hypothetical protein